MIQSIHINTILRFHEEVLIAFMKYAHRLSSWVIFATQSSACTKTQATKKATEDTLREWVKPTTDSEQNAEPAKAAWHYMN